MARAVPDGMGERLKAARIAANLSQDEVAQMLEVTRQAVSAWERNAKMLPAPYLAQMAAAYLTCAHRLLFGESFKDGQFRGVAQLRRTDPLPLPPAATPRRQRVSRTQPGVLPARPYVSVRA